jgi:hypothetical protein
LRVGDHGVGDVHSEESVSALGHTLGILGGGVTTGTDGKSVGSVLRPLLDVVGNVTSSFGGLEETETVGSGLHAARVQSEGASAWARVRVADPVTAGASTNEVGVVDVHLHRC